MDYKEKETVSFEEPIKEPTALLMGGLQSKTVIVEIAEGEGIYKPGTIMILTDDGKVKPFDHSESGSEDKVRYILASETLDLAYEKYASVYDQGEFYYGGIPFPAETTEEQKEKIINKLKEYKLYINQGESRCQTN